MFGGKLDFTMVTQGWVLTYEHNPRDHDVYGGGVPQGGLVGVLGVPQGGH